MRPHTRMGHKDAAVKWPKGAVVAASHTYVAQYVNNTCTVALMCPLLLPSKDNPPYSYTHTPDSRAVPSKADDGRPTDHHPGHEAQVQNSCSVMFRIS